MLAPYPTLSSLPTTQRIILSSTFFFSCCGHSTILHEPSHMNQDEPTPMLRQIIRRNQYFLCRILLQRVQISSRELRQQRGRQCFAQVFFELAWSLEILDGGLGWKLEDSFCFLPILDIVSTRSGDVSVRMLRTLQLNFKRRPRKLHGLLRT